MRLRKDYLSLFPLIDHFPNEPGVKVEHNNWNSIGEHWVLDVPKNKEGRFHGMLTQYCDGKVWSEEQYIDNKKGGIRVIYLNHFPMPHDMRFMEMGGHLTKLMFS